MHTTPPQERNAPRPRVGDRHNDPALVSLCGDLLQRVPLGTDDLPVGDPLRMEYEALSGPQRDRVRFFYQGASAQAKLREKEFLRLRDRFVEGVAAAAQAGEVAAQAEERYRGLRRRDLILAGICGASVSGLVATLVAAVLR